jgi:hypothetical protein
MTDDLYDVLQVSPDADQEFIESSYRRLMRTYDPETTSLPDAAAIREELMAAYETLGDPRRRAEYDRHRRLTESPAYATGADAGAYDSANDRAVQDGAASDAGPTGSKRRRSNPGRELLMMLVLIVGTFATTLLALTYFGGTPEAGPAPVADLAQSASAPRFSVAASSPVTGNAGTGLLVAGSQFATTGSASPATTPVALPTPAPVLVRLHFLAGDARRYSYTMKLTARAPDQSETQVDLKMLIRYRIVEVHPDESATITATYEHASVSTDGMTRDLPMIAGAGVRMRVAPDGTTSDVSAVGGVIPNDAAFDREALSQLMTYPAEPMAIGHDFSNQIRVVPAGSQALVVDSRVILEEIATLAGPERRRALVLKETASMPWTTIVSDGNTTAEGRIEGDATHYVDAETGWPIFGYSTLLLDVSGSTADRRVVVDVPMKIVSHYREER